MLFDAATLARVLTAPSPMLDGRVLIGDCRDRMAALPECSVDAVVTDPPYDLTAGKKGGTGPASVNLDTPAGRARIGVGFMGLAWDATSVAFDPATWREVLRVLKPGGHLVAFGGSRTWHRLASAIEDAGFEVRDSLMWIYGSGFPKSLDVSKAIDRAAGAERQVIGTKVGLPGYSLTDGNGDHRTYGRGLGNTGTGEAECSVTAPATPEAEQWDGWGTALKPAFEPIVLARKPLMGSVATNVLAHGTGALNIAGCRIAHEPGEQVGGDRSGEASATERYTDRGAVSFAATPGPRGGDASGRWPANLVLDGEAADLLDEQTGVLKSGANPTRRGSDKFRTAYGDFEGQVECVAHRGADEGGASRFFYVAKADEDERPVVDGVAHPTVKPLALMRWLIRLVTPPGGVVLDPFLGSGTTAEAALLEGFDWLGCERTEDYLPLIQARLDRFAAGRSPGLPQPRVRPQVPGQIDLFSEAS